MHASHAGLNNTVLVDEDGSFTGYGGGATIVPYNHDLVSGDTRAVYFPDMLAYIVPGGEYRQLYFESQDPDRYSRRIQVRITYPYVTLRTHLIHHHIHTSLRYIALFYAIIT